LASAIWTSAPHSRRDIWHSNSPAVQSYERLAAYVASRFGEPAVALFAIPARQSDGSISWSDRLGAEQTTSLKDLPHDESDRASTALRSSLQALETACDNSPDGQLLLAAMTIESPDAIRVADGRPILAGWGAVPASLTTPEQLWSHHWATLGPFLSRIEPPRFSVGSVATVAAGAHLYGSRALIGAVLLAALILAWLLLPGVLRDNVYLSRLPGVDFSDSNRSIERQIESVKRSLESNVCIATTLPRLEAPPATPPATGRPPGTDGPAAPGTVRPPGPSGENNPTPAPGSPRDQALLPPTPPVDPNSATVPPQANPGAGGAPVLATLLKKSTVIIVTKVGTGSGFFVSPDHILTNRHVTENAEDQFMVGNKALAQLLPADLVGVSDTSRIGSPDFALLKLRSGSSETFLSFSDSLPFELENVIATGYPGFVIREDENYRRMMRGDVRSVPDTALTSGGVTFIQNPTSEAPIILHYATISPGNSGGPLTDECGRVVGVNTFVRSDEGPNSRMNYALASSSAIQFLKRFSITPKIVPGRCTTAMNNNPPPPQNPAPDATPPSPTPRTDQPAAKSTPPSTPPSAPGDVKK
jgi:hypothetical protein